MITLLLRVLRLLPFLFAGHRQLALENLALHQQLAVYKRRLTRPRLRRIDHLSLDKDAPDGRRIEQPELGTIIPIPEVGGLHHRYVRRAA